MSYKILLLVILYLCCSPIEAKSYKFKINDPISDVSVSRSTTPGTKMVKVVATGKSVDRAIEKAMMDAVIVAAFYGIRGNEYIDNVPPILIDGLTQYEENCKWFNNFFKKGNFIQFVSMVNSNYPNGTNNVKTHQGRKVTIYLIIEWKKLEDLFKSQNFKTQSSFINL